MKNVKAKIENVMNSVGRVAVEGLSWTSTADFIFESRFESEHNQKRNGQDREDHEFCLLSCCWNRSSGRCFWGVLNFNSKYMRFRPLWITIGHLASPIPSIFFLHFLDFDNAWPIFFSIHLTCFIPASFPVIFEWINAGFFVASMCEFTFIPPNAWRTRQFQCFTFGNRYSGIIRMVFTNLNGHRCCKPSEKDGQRLHLASYFEEVDCM